MGIYRQNIPDLKTYITVALKIFHTENFSKIIFLHMFLYLLFTIIYRTTYFFFSPIQFTFFSVKC